MAGNFYHGREFGGDGLEGFKKICSKKKTGTEHGWGMYHVRGGIGTTDRKREVVRGVPRGNWEKFFPNKKKKKQKGKSSGEDYRGGLEKEEGGGCLARS